MGIKGQFFTFFLRLAILMYVVYMFVMSKSGTHCIFLRFPNLKDNNNNKVCGGYDHRYHQQLVRHSSHLW